MKLPESEKEKFHMLLMAAIDGELSDEDRARFDQYVQQYPECREEWQRYAKLKEVTKTMQFTKPAPEVWDRYWVGIYNRIERGFGWILLSIGCAILLTYGGFKAVEAILADSQLELVVKVGIIAVIGGLMILFVSALREKIFTARTDKYQKEVQR
jgi:predicted anti-sigma-YlaC factor YlaD